MNGFNVQGLSQWAEQLGEALGRGVARGINAGLANVGTGGAVTANAAPKRRGRPPKNAAAVGAGETKCSEAGCQNPARSKGLCSKHYQAARRKALGK